MRFCAWLFPPGKQEGRDNCSKAYHTVMEVGPVQNDGHRAERYGGHRTKGQETAQHHVELFRRNHLTLGRILILTYQHLKC